MLDSYSLSQSTYGLDEPHLVTAIDSSELLIVEDNPGDRLLFEEYAEQSRLKFSKITQLTTFQQAIGYLREQLPACCIIDYNLPGGTGQELCEQLIQLFGELPCPIVISTSKGSEQLAASILRLGVSDYLVKANLTAREFGLSIEHAIETYRLRDRLKHLAHYDPLTGLVNRALFQDRLNQAFAESKRQERHITLLTIDIDHFKQINDNFGHSVGDQILQHVAQAIQSVVRQTDTAARIGGDEFSVLLLDCPSYQSHFVAQKLGRKINEVLQLGEQTFEVTTSIGMAEFCENLLAPQELIDHADQALYEAKHRGRAYYRKFDQNIYSKIKDRQLLSTQLELALERDEIDVYYQPIVDIESSHCIAVEALVRWRHNGQWIEPQEILATVNSHQLSGRFHARLLTRAFKQLTLWRQTQPGLKLHLNMNRQGLADAEVLLNLEQCCNQFDGWSGLVLDLTDASNVFKSKELMNTLVVLKDKGIQISIEESAVAKATFAEFVAMVHDIVKVGPALIAKAAIDRESKNYLQLLILAHEQLGRNVIASKVETSTVLAVAQAHSINTIQGYIQAKPVIACDSFEIFLNNARNRLL